MAANRQPTSGADVGLILLTYARKRAIDYLHDRFDEPRQTIDAAMRLVETRTMIDLTNAQQEMRPRIDRATDLALAALGGAVSRTASTQWRHIIGEGEEYPLVRSPGGDLLPVGLDKTPRQTHSGVVAGLFASEPSRPVSVIRTAPHVAPAPGVPAGGHRSRTRWVAPTLGIAGLLVVGVGYRPFVYWVTGGFDRPSPSSNPDPGSRPSVDLLPSSASPVLPPLPAPTTSTMPVQPPTLPDDAWSRPLTKPFRDLVGSKQRGAIKAFYRNQGVQLNIVVGTFGLEGDPAEITLTTVPGGKKVESVRLFGRDGSDPLNPVDPLPPDGRHDKRTVKRDWCGKAQLAALVTVAGEEPWVVRFDLQQGRNHAGSLAARLHVGGQVGTTILSSGSPDNCPTL